jgi:hypothetical protein
MEDRELDPNEVTNGDASSNPSSEQTSAESNQPIVQHSAPSEPNTYPGQPNCPVHVVWSVMTKINSPGTSSVFDTFYCDTTLANYAVDIPTECEIVYAYVYRQQSLPADVEVHWRVTMENPTAPAMRMGGYPLNKESIDGLLTSLNIQAATDLSAPMLQSLPQMKQRARY